MASLCFLLFISVCASARYTSAAEPMGDFLQYYMQLLIECSREFPISENVLEQLKRRELPLGDNVKCLFACVYKKGGMMDQQGYISVQAVNELTKQYITDPVLLQKAIQFTEACKEVNDVTVSDGARGCDRAALLYKCSLDKALQFNTTVPA